MIYIYFLIYVVVINIIGFCIMYIDKKSAIKGEYRISERGIFIISLLLGAIGVYIGMYKFRHKTLHKLFTIGIPICIVINILTIYNIFAKNLLFSLANYLNI